jgi:alanine racemase
MEREIKKPEATSGVAGVTAADPSPEDTSTWLGRPTWAEIDLDAVYENVRALSGCLRPGTAIMAVLKANAYGHGAVPVAEAALAGGATTLGVACVDEAIELRQAGVDAPILNLGYLPHWEAEKVIRYRVTPTVTGQSLALALGSISRARGIETGVHVKVDTGMGRYGILPEETVDFVTALGDIPGLRVDGIFTHFATADEPDGVLVARQLATFSSVLNALEARGLRPPVRHAANTAAALYVPQSHFEMVRCGLGIYGYYPTPDRAGVHLRPALALKSRLGRIRTLPPGSCVGYGCAFKTERPTRVGLVPLGYADGWSRELSNRGEVLVGGRRCPIIGRVSMDQLSVELPGDLVVGQDDEVVALGRQGDQEITADDVAGWRGTISYEVLTGLAPRVPRLFRWRGRVVARLALIADESAHEIPLDRATLG